MPFFGDNGAASLDAFLGDHHSDRFPGTVKATLFTTAPAGTYPGVQVSGGGFVPVLLDNDSTTWPDADTTLLRKTNGIQIVFPTATADWGDIVAYGLLRPDDSLLWHGLLAPTVTVLSGQTRRFDIGKFIVVGI